MRKIFKLKSFSLVLLINKGGNPVTAERVKQFVTGLLLPASLQVKPDTATLLNTHVHMMMMMSTLITSQCVPRSSSFNR